MPLDEPRLANRAAWDTWTDDHVKAGAFGLSQVRSGRTSLTPIDLEEVGDVRGKSLLHLMCHIGTDTLSWAREGANVTGVDFSPRAIATARSLAAELGIAARFGSRIGAGGDYQALRIRRLQPTNSMRRLSVTNSTLSTCRRGSRRCCAGQGFTRSQGRTISTSTAS